MDMSARQLSVVSDPDANGIFLTCRSTSWVFIFYKFSILPHLAALFYIFAYYYAAYPV
jgi:hypothetical protein